MERSNEIGWAQVRAGVFIVAALIFIAGGILLMGQKTKMFTSKGKLQVIMSDVAGLKEGAPVWLAGVDVGVVTAIGFANPEKNNEVTIQLEADKGALRKIGSDSSITIKTRGLMGEKYVDITPSQSYSLTQPTILHGTSVARLDDVIQKAGTTFDRVNTVVDSITQGKGTLGKLNTDPALYQNIVKLTNELSDLTITINRGEGTLGKLNRSPEPYNKLISILNRADRTLQDIQASEGSLNKLIHDKTLYDKLVSLADKSVEAAQDVRELNKKLTSQDSTIGQLIGSRELYDKGLSLLTRADNSVKAIEEITGRVNKGEGSLGKAINEQELYERLNKMVDSVDLLVSDIKKNPGRYVKFSLF
ncbi:MlaD family protein [Geobacter sp. SVR]|uniref:MlaD family protein n=1 Tax=Geobacter sp. SVR TaxID=2495594 RepID=UPI00143F042D|nr:MlaD family protein [Geobacter sp. SVR]BCS52371.1 ABC transporter substrate-binding protein [Geobacter sp. SVR]GCF84970.1 ABC transporter substrate-binding protein [Geobacter sp. SVR]